MTSTHSCGFREGFSCPTMLVCTSTPPAPYISHPIPVLLTILHSTASCTTRWPSLSSLTVDKMCPDEAATPFGVWPHEGLQLTWLDVSCQQQNGQKGREGRNEDGGRWSIPCGCKCWFTAKSLNSDHLTSVVVQWPFHLSSPKSNLKAKIYILALLCPRLSFWITQLICAVCTIRTWLPDAQWLVGFLEDLRPFLTFLSLEESRRLARLMSALLGKSDRKDN